jgi:hypothetical protein
MPSLIRGPLQITFVDFLAYDILDLHLIFEPTCLDAFPNLKDFVARFEVMPWSFFPLAVNFALMFSWAEDKNQELSNCFLPVSVPSTLHLLIRLIVISVPPWWRGLSVPLLG